ncbi:MBL fold metallo-hydrolase [Edaphobacillus lindanitolerans]|uniref:L-ascorbate metabolism protein UlaG, beta-lactamase superfamily n=1 Tax=Edaphobacillus lindanitolerans TaxID=550447 RepID=A0A1U7PMH4_9BACI|nr:MBL fold metallo-hydrolase [Edaphobacillus lindanitolerans]SIT90845.1 L-ascorbate metabolism protein UlaG, beta-lactamase superfamily [Edaphobacillus lindanitolerans]
MHIQLIRNATLNINYAGTKFLVDPFLAEKGSYPPFPDSARQEEQNPLVELPVAIDQLTDADAVIVTHLHLDHYDEKAIEVLPKNIPMFVQNDADAEEVRKGGFTQVTVLTEDTEINGICLAKTKGEHGRGEILNIAGDVCGIVFTHPSEKTLYVAGDTVWYHEVEKTIIKYKPDVIVINAGDNQFNTGGSLIMGKEDVHEVYKAAPDAKIIAAHMEAVNHWTLSREELKEYILDHGMQNNVFVPADGEAYDF